MKQVIAVCILLITLINPAFLKRTACGDEPDDTYYDCASFEIDDEKLKNDTFYAAIKETMTSKNYTNYDRFLGKPERIDCIINELKDENAMTKLNDTTYEFVKSEEDDKIQVNFQNITVTMESLERMIQDANFNCQGMNTFRIMFIIFLVILTVLCLALCIRVRLLKRVKWSSVEH